MKRYLFLLFFAILMITSACRKKCVTCEGTMSNGVPVFFEGCIKDYGNKADWEAAIKEREDLGAVCTKHR